MTERRSDPAAPLKFVGGRVKFDVQSSASDPRFPGPFLLGSGYDSEHLHRGGLNLPLTRVSTEWPSEQWSTARAPWGK